MNMAEANGALLAGGDVSTEPFFILKFTLKLGKWNGNGNSRNQTEIVNNLWISYLALL